MANAFRHRFDADEMVCPIERIADVDLGLDIIPVENLYRQFGESRSSGYMTQDRTAIVVDDYCCHHMEETYRFTLAHELAHLELHEDWWEQCAFNSPEDWRRAIQSGATDAEYRGIEWQANAFAGLVLVPREFLQPLFEREGSRCAEILGRHEGHDRQTSFDIALEDMCDRVSQEFAVHPVTVGVRADYDGLTDALAARLFGDNHGTITRGRLLERHG